MKNLFINGLSAISIATVGYFTIKLIELIYNYLEKKFKWKVWDNDIFFLVSLIAIVIVLTLVVIVLDYIFCIDFNSILI